MSKRHRFLVCYDIADAKRLRRVAKVCESYGSRIQFSVFESALTNTMMASLRAELDAVINHDTDQILFVNLGADDASTPFTMEYLGLPYVKKNRVTII
ncbi:MAG: CRISPR-associated endonuclease Cas2 [Akkermansiaceae bacterium]|nr:CRISPR-associated endonuclease Cas2 [Akkermansiaceae bacterium]